MLIYQHKWISISGISRETGLPAAKIREFIYGSDLLIRASKKNSRGDVLYALTDNAKAKYTVDHREPTDIFSHTRQLLVDGRLQEAIRDYFSILKSPKSALPENLRQLYKQALIEISNQFYQVEALWASDTISTRKRFAESDRFIYKLYESILELEILYRELHTYRFKFKHVTIRIEKEYNTFNQSDKNQIVQMVSDSLDVSSDEFRVTTVERGSVIMTLEFDTSEQAENLYLLIKLGKLKENGISDAKLKMLSENISLRTDNTESEFLQIYQQTKTMIQEGKAEDVIQLLLQHLSLIGEEFQNPLILLSADMNALSKRASLGLDRLEDIRILRNKLTYSLLGLLDDIKESKFASQ